MLLIQNHSSQNHNRLRNHMLMSEWIVKLEPDHRTDLVPTPILIRSDLVAGGMSLWLASRILWMVVLILLPRELALALPIVRTLVTLYNLAQQPHRLRRCRNLTTLVL